MKLNHCSMNTNWSEIVAHYEKCLEKHGDNHLGVDWPNVEDATKRYQIMFELINGGFGTNSLLDYGCGAGHFIEGVVMRGFREPNSEVIKRTYFGYDKSDKMIALCKSKHPNYQFSSTEYPVSDYVIMNGVFTEKRSITFGQMWTMVQAELLEVWAKTRKGLAFNVMSPNVDYEKDFLFHLPMDLMANFVVKNLSRKFQIRHDYLPYEYTVYVYRAD